MSIAVSTKNDVFLLSTESTSYAFGIDDRGLVRHLYWGKKLRLADELELPAAYGGLHQRPGVRDHPGGVSRYTAVCVIRSTA